MREHGTHACYVWGPEPGSERGRGCRCDDCREASVAYNRQLRQRVAPSYVGAAQVREHLQFLRAHGVGLRTVARRSGISHGALSKLVYGDSTRGRGPSKRVRVETRDRILSVQPSDVAAGGRVDATRTWEAIGTLLERGWTKRGIARAIGKDGELQLSRRRVTAANARAVAALLDEPVPPRRSRWGIHPQEQPEENETTVEAPATPVRIDTISAAPWRAHSACRLPGVPVWMFFPGRGDSRTTDAALAVCDSCPVKDDCLDAHIGERFGIWGGTTERERRRLRRERGIPEDDDQAESEAA